MSFAKTIATSLMFGVPAIFIGIAAGFHPDAVAYGVAAAGGVFTLINYRPK